MINTIANNAALALFSPRNIANGIQLQLTAGIMEQFLNPLNANRFAAAVMPDFLMLRCFCGLPNTPVFGPPPFAGPNQGPSQGIAPGGCYRPDLDIGIPTPVEPVETWTAKTTGEGRAEVDLGDGYTLKFNERSSEIEIFNANTGEHTRIWGDPHVDVDGKRVFDFWGTTTFTLENGTKITINTEQWNGNPNAYVASQVVITKGSNALVVDGISQNQLGDLSLTMSNNGYAVDAAHRDGFVLHENATGSSWRSEHTGRVATQCDLNATRVGGIYGPGSEMPSLEELLPRYGNFLLFGAFMRFASDLGNVIDDVTHQPRPQPRFDLN